MKMTWKKTPSKKVKPPLTHFPNLPFDAQQSSEDVFQDKSTEINDSHLAVKVWTSDSDDNNQNFAQIFEEQGNQLAEDGKYREALGKWETALTLLPERAVLHEQKAQILLDLGEAWSALKSAKRATELEPAWAEAWITLGRAQLNFGEPDSAIESLDRALAIKPESTEALADKQTALHLINRRKQLHSAGLSASENRFFVTDKSDS